MEYKGMKEDERFISVTPSKRQIAYQNMEYFCFIHFTVNTFTGSEWGLGDEPESIFNPEELDARQWAKTAAEGGMKGLILTCKHHDGFCLWPSKYTEHSIKNSPYKNGKGDIVRETAEACKEYGLKFGVYLSPWDRNNESYGKGKEYDDYYVNQLTELLTNYGDIFVIWLDGACGEGSNGKKQVYDWQRYYEVMRKLQPNAVISISGPDIRWCGNEAGQVRPSEWSVVAADMTDPAITAQLSQQEDNEEFRNRPLDETQADLGSRECLRNEEKLAYYPAETDVSIRPGWFWHLEEEPHSLERLFTTYLGSVGSNACMHLNLPPNTDGRIDERDVKRLKEFGALLQEEFGTELDVKIREEESPKTQKAYTISLKQPTAQIRYVSLREDLTKGQRVEGFRITAQSGSGNQYPLYQGTVIGNRKICQLQNPFGEQNPLINDMEDRICQIQVQITAARDEVFLKDIKIY